MKSIVKILVFFTLSIAAHGATLDTSKGDLLINNKLHKKNTAYTLKVGDIVESKGKKAFSQWKLEDGSLIRIRDASVRVLKLNKTELTWKLEHGKLYAFVRPETTKKRKFSFRSKSATMGVRGTKFMIEESDYTYLCVCEGTVGVEQSIGKKTHSTDVTVGEDLDIFQSKAIKKPREATTQMINMVSDEFKAMGHPVQ